MPLTDRQIQLAKTDGADLFLGDGKGLYLRVRTSGSKNWLYRYKDAEGKTRWLDLDQNISTYPTIPLLEARSLAATLNVMRRRGLDPLEERRLEAERKDAEMKAAANKIAADIARLTVLELFGRWERLELSRRKDKGAEARRSFEKDVFPAVGAVAAEDITRAMVVGVLDSVVERGARIVARELLGNLRQMFGFAIVRGLVEHDPTSRLKRDDFGKKVERNRTLSEAEIKALPGKLADARMAEQNMAAIWIMLSTCCRVGEISRARWAEIDLDAGTWRIPADNAKNAKEHMIHLSLFAIQHFQTLQRLAAESPWALPARYTDEHVCLKSLAKQIGDRQRGDKPPMKCRSVNINALALPGGKWTPHDLRRTGATTMGALGVRPDVIEKCLNHVEQNKLVRIYQRQELKAEQAEAWRLLGERLELLLRADVDNVLMLRKLG
jgi:integrase